MNTPTHLLVGAALFCRPANEPRHYWRNSAVLFGALLPDLAIFVLFAWARFYAGISEQELWRETYWSEPWQSIITIGNSIPLFGILGLVALVARQRWLLYLVLAALAHIALDFPFHADDAHRHFWPFTEWRFHSPLSYWDSRHFGDIVSLIEGVFAIGLALLLWRRFHGWVVRGLLILALALYGIVPIYFSLSLGG